MNNMIEVLAQVQSFCLMMTNSELSQEARWKAWVELRKHGPQWAKDIDHALSLSPNEALDFVIAQFGQRADTVRFMCALSPQWKELPEMAERAIGEIQRLHKNREEAKPKKKRKGKKR